MIAGHRYTLPQAIGALEPPTRFWFATGSASCRDITLAQYAVLSERSKIKRRTMERRKKEYLALKAA